MKKVYYFLKDKIDMNTFQTKSRAIELLGRKQIRDGITALIELIKNAYDADAEWCHVIFNNEYVLPYIMISDSGSGMSENDILNKWLVIGTEAKKKRERVTPKKKRVLMGEKGIGRLAASILGQQLLLFTKSESDGKWNILFLGMLLLLLAFKNITDKKSICKMIELIKFIRYDNEFEELIDITIDNINNPDFNSIIMNKYYCGDILINESSDDEFLLCITPPCDLFRPDKSNYCLKFLRGKKSEPSKLTKSLKVYEHATIIPINEKPTVIIWSFNNEKIFCLKNIEDLNELKKYLRPFRMKEDYIKQIISKYSSFCMRMGVDELFLKENPIGKGFLSILNK